MGKRHSKINIGIFGFGTMGQAIFELLKSKSANSEKFRFFVATAGKVRGSEIVQVSGLDDLVVRSDLIFLCVKPQDFHKLQPAKLKSKNCVFISIIAGINTRYISGRIGSKRIVRAMPNLPLKIGKGVTGWFAPKNGIMRRELKFISDVFDMLGDNFRVKNEAMLDAVTAIFGSGPAYVMLFQKALADSAKKFGIDAKIAEKMTASLISGSIALYLHSGKKPEEIISMIKSKRGTTEAALKEINMKRFLALWQNATKKAYLRSQELSSYEIK